MHQIQLSMGGAPDPTGGAHHAPHSLAGFKGSYSKGRERRVEGKSMEREGGEGGNVQLLCSPRDHILAAPLVVT